MIDKSIRRAYSLLLERNYLVPKIYWTIDLHDTCIKGTHKPGEYTWINEDVIKTLKFINSFPESVIILWSSCYDEEKKNVKKFFAERGVRYEYFNENPEAKDTLTGHFREKFYSSIIIDDAAGFEPESDWKLIYDTLVSIKFKTKRKLRIFIDMDHTFCDMEGAIDVWKNWALTEIEKKCPWSMKGLFANMLPMAGALDFYDKYSEQCELWFLTRPSIKNIHCYTEKAEWVKRYFGEQGLEKLILSPKKDLLIGDILIDDSGKYGQETFNGEWWQFGTEEFKNWKDIDDKLHNKLQYT